MIRLALAGLHLLALGIGLGAVWTRARAVSAAVVDRTSLRRTLAADSLWGLSAVLWIGTGLWRVLAQTEKSTTYYMSNHLFFAKMGLLVLILLLELAPMITLIRWRGALGKGAAPGEVASAAGARRIATISYVQALIVAVMVFVAVAMARGFGG